MQITYSMTEAELVEKNGVDVMSMTVAQVTMMAEAAQKKRTDGLHAGMTLTDLYWQSYRQRGSIKKKVSEDTLRQREKALRLWAELTGNPPLREITQDTLDEFVQKMEAVTWCGKPLAPATIAKHCDAIKSVLGHAGPKSKDYPHAQGLLAEVPQFDPIPEADWNDTTEKTPTLEEFEALLEHAHVAKYPQLPDISPQEWWQNTMTFIYQTGVRYTELMTARWTDIRTIRGRPSLVVRCRSAKMHRERIIPLTDIAQQVLQDMPRQEGVEEIFHFPHNEKTLRKYRRKIAEAAGVTPKRSGFHAIRRLVGTLVGAASLVLGHRRSDVTLAYYQAADRIGTELDKLPKLHARKEVAFGY